MIDTAVAIMKDYIKTNVEIAIENINTNTKNVVANARENINTNTKNTVANARENINTNTKNVVANARENINTNTKNVVANARENINTNTNNAVTNARENINTNTNNAVTNAKQEIDKQLAVGFADLETAVGENKNLIEEVYKNIDNRLTTEFDEVASTLSSNYSNLFNNLTSTETRIIEANSRIIETNSRLINVETRLIEANNRLISTENRVIESNNRLINLEGIASIQSTTISNGFSGINTNLSNIEGNLAKASETVGNNVVNALSKKIDNLKLEIMGTDSSKTLTYIASQNQNNLANTKSLVDLMGKSSDTETTDTVFGRLSKITSDVARVENKIDTIDDNVDEILNRVTSTSLFSGYRQDQLEEIIANGITNSKTTEEIVNEALGFMVQHNLIKIN